MQRLILPVFLLLIVALSIDSRATTLKKRGKMAPITLESAAFGNGAAIPSAYTCDGADRSPPLTWRGVPSGTRSLALICDDPDAPAGIWVHWVVYGMPAALNGLPEGVPMADTVEGGGRQGTNDFGNIGYNGPCPPGGTHRYSFRLYALDRLVEPGAGKKKSDIEKAMKGHVLAQGELIGTYSRGK